MAVVALLTDFGLSDPYVGEMKAVMLRFAPGVTVVDVTHGISPGAVREAAWVLAKTWSQFPEGTCHLAVVDPGVGSDRRALAASAGRHTFVGPDNGLLAAALAAAGGAEVRQIATREIEHRRRGSTFDGRDVFAPVAARLAAGLPLTELGPEVDDWATLPTLEPRAAGGSCFDAEIVRVDRFGNLVLAVEEDFLRSTFGESWRDVGVLAASTQVRGVRLAYQEVPPGEALLSIGGAGTLEISVNRGSAAKRLRLKAGDRVSLQPPLVDTGQGSA